MNGIKYLADTNCFIYLLDENPLVLPFIGGGWAYSYITEIELLSKRDIKAREENLIKEVLHSCYKLSHSQTLTDLIINLKRNSNLKLPDAIIAASAQLLQLPLITADKVFAKITDIDCIILDIK